MLFGSVTVVEEEVLVDEKVSEPPLTPGTVQELGMPMPPTGFWTCLPIVSVMVEFATVNSLPLGSVTVYVVPLK